MATSYKLKTLDGTAAAPAYTFEDDGDTGIYSYGADALGFSVAGTHAASVQSRQFVMQVGLSGALPVYTSSAATDTGINPRASTVETVVAGSQKITVSSTQLKTLNLQDIHLAASKGIAIKESSAANASALSDYGKIYLDSSTRSLYYINESNETFYFDMTAV